MPSAERDRQGDRARRREAQAQGRQAAAAAYEVALLVLLRQIDVALPPKAKERLRKWLAGTQPQAVGSELALSEALRVTMTERVARTMERAESYARLRDRYVERNPAVMGGEPVIAGTRMPVRTIARLIEMGESHEVLREDYPQVPKEAYPVAVLWAHANPRRGRPTASEETGCLPSPIYNVHRHVS